MAVWPFTHKKQNQTPVPLDTKAGTIAAPDIALMALFGSQASLSGANVNPSSAMRVPAVAAAVGVISDACGTLPAKAFTRLAKGGKEPALKHPAHALVHDTANDWTSAAQLRTQLTADALLHGNGYAFANRVNGKVQEFIRLDPATVTPQVDSETGEPSYKVQTKRQARIYPFRDILHISAFTGTDGITGIAPIEFAREAIGLSMTLEAHAARLFSNGGKPSGLLKFSGKLDPETSKRISESWHAAHGGENSGRTAVLEDGGEFQVLSFNSVDSQFEQMRRFQIIEIARAFRVAPQFLMDLERATFSNAEEMNRQFLQFTLLPWLRAWEAAYTRTLLSPEERATTSIEFVLDDFLRADTGTRVEAYGKFRAMGVLTANEVRAMENKPPIDGGNTLQNPFTTSAGTTP